MPSYAAGMAQFKVGDVVQLQSGGPKMTVVDPAKGDVGVKCCWFAPTDFLTPKYGNFPTEALKASMPSP